MPRPRWLEKVEEAILCRSAGVVLTMNTTDRVHLGAEGLEVASLKYALTHAFALKGYHVGSYSPGLGFRELAPPRARHGQKGPSPFAEIPAVPNTPAVLKALGRLLRQRASPVLLLIDYADHVAPQSGDLGAMLTPEQRHAFEILHSWGLDDDVKASGNLVVLLSYENRVNGLLTRGGGYRAVEVDLPGAADRQRFIEFLERVRDSGGGAGLGGLQEGLTVPELARITGGLRLMDIEEAFRLSAGRCAPVSREAVREAKARTMAQLCGQLLEVVEPERGFEAVAGNRHAKSAFEMMRSGWQAGTPSVPQAVLFSGVPGCGKSFVVSALAREYGCPLVVMRNVREQWVGASERNLEAVLWVLRMLSPCILWTDEVDQVVGGRGAGASGTSGTEERMFGRILEFFGSMSHRGRILWVATTNRPDLLDPALLDRFQLVLPFIHPTRGERAEMLPVLARQLERHLATDVHPDEIAGRPELEIITVRALFEIMARAGRMADHEVGGTGAGISRRHLIAALEDYKPTFDPIEHEFLALKALQMTSFHSDLPWMGTSGHGGPGEWPPYVDAVIDGKSGRLRVDVLSYRIAELEQQRAARNSLR